MAKATEVYSTSNGAATKAYYAELQSRGPIGIVALNLFRAQKCSSRAKTYRRGYAQLAYERKQWSMENLCAALMECGDSLGIRFGWKEDPKTRFGEGSSWVLYVDLPNGQVSFHSPIRGKGPDYAGEWDRARMSEERIIAFCEGVNVA